MNYSSGGRSFPLVSVLRTNPHTKLSSSSSLRGNVWHTAAGLRHHSFATATAAAVRKESDLRKVIVTDPVFLFDKGHPDYLFTHAGRASYSQDTQDHETASEAFVQVTIPNTLYDNLAQPTEDQEESDQAINYFYFGEKDEVFRYKFVGSHKAVSGLTCVINAAHLAHNSPNPFEEISWAQFSDWQKHKWSSAKTSGNKYTYPAAAVTQDVRELLFLGVLEDSYGLSAAQVYALGGSDPVQRVGLMVHSHYQSEDD
eukprot:TRINITY_DN1183_c0_g1_i2.p1 TRINITY_DN1183_c0_g1~~TRINITY_DN1183_c0_g1_i2.p1  ORF type:complete len:256 (+),score=41.94 TRINITY_DN1183_c0_g1_i2:288-1055(+)